MKRFAVSSRGRASVEVRASNWVAALGLGLAHYDAVEGLDRLACEVLPNGTVIARDIGTGAGFIVQEASQPVEEAEQPELVDEGSILTGEPAEDSEDTRLRESLSSIRAAPSRGKACRAALVLARKVVSAEAGVVILEDSDSLRFYAAAGPRAHRLVGARLPLDTGIAGFCMRTGRPLILDDVLNDPRHVGDVDRFTGTVTHALACSPVVHHERVFGVIEMINLPDNTTFSRRCVHELNAIALALGERLHVGHQDAGS